MMQKQNVKVNSKTLGEDERWHEQFMREYLEQRGMHESNPACTRVFVRACCYHTADSCQLERWFDSCGMQDITQGFQTQD